MVLDPARPPVVRSTLHVFTTAAITPVLYLPPVTATPIVPHISLPVLISPLALPPAVVAPVATVVVILLFVTPAVVVVES